MFAGVDLGSRWIGCVISDFPARLGAEPRTVEVHDVGQAVADVVTYVSAHRARVVVLEHGKFYVMAGASAPAIMAMVEAHEVCTVLHDRITRELDARGIPHATVARATWTHRVLPRTRGGITDRMAHDALAAHVVDPGDLERLTDAHQRDALGALLGWCLPRPRREQAHRDRRVKIPDAAWELRKAATAERVRRYDVERRQAERGQPVGCAPRLEGVTGRACARCGGPRKGHVRGLACPVPTA